MRSRVLRVALLLFGSGFTALVYQTVWMRELRLIFGFSTASSAAVVAIFLGGIGVGSVVLGRRANRSERPLIFFGRLELGIAVSAAATPGLLWLARQAYTVLGGSFRLGMAAGTVVRLVLSALVLCVPTVLMGGSLPAASRAVESDEDLERRRLAFIYGANTLGAVAGALFATFFLLEALGNRATLWLACVVNALVAVLAVGLGRTLLVRDAESPEAGTPASRAARRSGGPPLDRSGAEARMPALPPRRLVFVSAAVVGFVFLLMELVWYRMLSPLLGGSTYTFGLILAVALSGIGIGAALYSRSGRRSATLSAFATTCALEAVCLAAPYALGDRLALFAILTRSIGGLGFYGHVAAWTELTAIVVLPAAIVAGYQFPLLVALLGRGRGNVAEDVGLAYAWNTGGTILGSLAGGFGLLPLLTAPGAWKLSVFVLAALGALLAEVDNQTVRTAYATLASVFPSVETWYTKKSDLLLVASGGAVRYPAAALRERVRTEPYRSALSSAWRVTDLEGFLSHFVARDSLARSIALAEKGVVNTDDRNFVEFAFARSVGQGALFTSDDLRDLARSRDEDRPPVGGAVDWENVDRQRLSTLAAEGSEGSIASRSPAWDRRAAAFAAFVSGQIGEARRAWKADPWEPAGAVELAMVGEALADGGDEMALTFAKSLQELQPAEAEGIVARFLWTRSDWQGCFDATRAAFVRYREDPWPLPFFMKRLLAIAASLPSKEPRLAAQLDELLIPRFSVSLIDEDRALARLTISQQRGAAAIVEALQPLEPHFPWSGEFLGLRARAYEETRDPRADRARREADEFRLREPIPLGSGISIPTPEAKTPGG